MAAALPGLRRAAAEEPAEPQGALPGATHHAVARLPRRAGRCTTQRRLPPSCWRGAGRRQARARRRTRGHPLRHGARRPRRRRPGCRACRGRAPCQRRSPRTTSRCLLTLFLSSDRYRHTPPTTTATTTTTATATAATNAATTTAAATTSTIQADTDIGVGCIHKSPPRAQSLPSSSPTSYHASQLWNCDNKCGFRGSFAEVS